MPSIISHRIGGSAARQLIFITPPSAELSPESERIYRSPIVLRKRGRDMIFLLYFDWNGSKRELAEWNSRIKESSEVEGVRYIGLYGSLNEKWNHVSMFETESFDSFLSMVRRVGRPHQMTHYITEILMPQKLKNANEKKD